MKAAEVMDEVVEGRATASEYVAARAAEVAFVVPGSPVPKERARVVRGHAFTPERTRTAEAAIAWAAKAAGVVPLSGPVALTCLFYCRNNVRGDIDNLVKLCSDALNGVAWADDKQVVRLSATVAIDKANPRTWIKIGVVNAGA